MIDDDPLWALLAQSWRSVKGVAGRTVARLHAQLPEIGTYSNKSIAKLVGVAPLADDSGTHKGKRRIRGGRAEVRSILFIVARTAARYDKSLADFHARLTHASSLSVPRGPLPQGERAQQRPSPFPIEQAQRGISAQ